MALNIKACFARHGLTAKEVAKRMGMTNVNLSVHMNRNPSVEVLQRIADAVGCDIVELFDSPYADRQPDIIITDPRTGEVKKYIPIE